MKWQADYVVEKKSGKREERTETFEARSVREAAMLANSVIVRPLKSQKENKSVTITSLRTTEHA